MLEEIKMGFRQIIIRFLIVLFIVFHFRSSLSFADIIRMKDGREIECIIVFKGISMYGFECWEPELEMILPHRVNRAEVASVTSFKEADNEALRTAWTRNEKLNSTPDMTQTDPRAKLPGGGEAYCAPVSVSNSLVWLAERGFESLMPKAETRIEAQAKVAGTLGSVKYMNTNLDSGTSVNQVLNGLSKYLKDCGYDYRRLEYQGWRRHQAEFSTGTAVPELEWIKDGLTGKSAVWLNIGWYKHTPSTDEYQRAGGHWVTLVGSGVDGSWRRNPNALIVHDPSSRAGRRASHNYVHLEKIFSGKLTGKNFGLPRSAVGYFKMGDGLKINPTADCGILDGVVVLQM